MEFRKSVCSPQTWDGNPESSERVHKKSFGTDSECGEDEVKDQVPDNLTRSARKSESKQVPFR